MRGFGSSSLRIALVLAGLAVLGRAQDIGHPGPSYAGADSRPSGVKPQSKLWFHAGSWWGALWSTTAQAFTVHRLALDGHAWTDTGVVLETRPGAHTDCLLEGNRLYVVSHEFTEGPGALGHPLLVSRYVHDGASGTWTRSAGFPVQLDAYSTEAATIARDSTGVSWVAWTRGLRVWVAHSTTDDATWSAPIPLPTNDQDLDSDDNCAVIAFGGDRIGVMWSDEVTGPYWFSAHVDGAPAGEWTPREEALPAAVFSDDQVHMKAAADGRVFAAVKTAANEVRLLVRAPDGTWTGTSVTSSAIQWTRPSLVLDEEARTVHVFGTWPIPVGTIYRKVSSMDALSFEPGLGEPVILDALVPDHNDGTSTKQSVDGTSGLVLLATHQAQERYWHHFEPLGPPIPVAPAAAFDGEPVSGFAPLTVRFSEFSGGAPTSWSWTFGDGETSTERHPEHVYELPGTYSVGLTVANALGTDTRVRTNLVMVEPAPLHLDLAAIADAYVSEEFSDSRYGDEEFLRVRAGAGTAHRAFVSFVVPPSGNVVTSAVLHLACTDPSPDGGSVHAVDPAAWSEPTLSWSSAPPLPSVAIGALGPVEAGAVVELDVTAAVQTAGTYSFALASGSTNSAYYASRESGDPPRLVLTLAPPLPAADFGGAPLAGTAPLAVTFTDLSTGAPSAWAWDFGDGATSTARHPVHVFTEPGRYTVRLDVSNATGAGTRERVDLVVVVGRRPGGAIPAPQGPFPTTGPLAILLRALLLRAGLR